MTQRLHIASIDEVPPGSGREFVVDGKMIALFNVEGTFHAMDGICPHAGGPLGQGQLDGCVVTCPWHGWQFDVTTGQHCLNANLMHPRYEIVVEGVDIYVKSASESGES